MGPLEMAAAKKERILTAIKRRASGTANPVADLVTGDGAKHDWKQKPFEGDNTCVGKNASGDQKRIPGKKKTNEKAGFDKDDGADQRGAAGAD
jgi:hypothetical protein